MKKKLRNKRTKNPFSILVIFLTIVGLGFMFLTSMYYEPSWNFNWSNIRKNIRDSITLSKYRGITSGVGGMGISTENEVRTRIWVMTNATEHELLRLTEYPNGTIKAIAYEGLLRKKEFNKKAELTLRALKDTTYLLSYQSGCIGWERKIGDYLIKDILMIDDEMPPPPPGMNSNIKLTEMEKRHILLEYKKQKKTE